MRIPDCVKRAKVLKPCTHATQFNIKGRKHGGGRLAFIARRRAWPCEAARGCARPSGRRALLCVRGGCPHFLGAGGILCTTTLMRAFFTTQSLTLPRPNRPSAARRQLPSPRLPSTSTSALLVSAYSAMCLGEGGETGNRAEGSAVSSVEDRTGRRWRSSRQGGGQQSTARQTQKHVSAEHF